MQLLSRQGLAFICVPKTGSTSISKTLVDWSSISYSRKPSLIHMTANTFHEHIVPFHSGLFPDIHIETFCLIRHPVDWVQSWYRYRSRREISDKGKWRNRNYCGDISFEEFVEEVISSKPPPYAQIRNQAKYILLDSGEIGVDRIFLFENGMKAVENYISTKIGVDLQIPFFNSSPSKEIGVTDSVKQLLLNHFQEDFDLYNLVNS